MSVPFVRATVSREACEMLDGTEVQQAPMHLADFGDGERFVAPASALNVISISVNDGPDKICVVLLHSSIAHALSCVLSTDDARAVANQLIERAFAAETAAAKAARAALTRAGGRA